MDTYGYSSRILKWIENGYLWILTDTIMVLELILKEKTECFYGYYLWIKPADIKWILIECGRVRTLVGFHQALDGPKRGHCGAGRR